MTFETRADQENEEEACREIEQVLGVSIIKFGQKSVVDRVLFRGKGIVAFGEVKCRHMTFDAYARQGIFLAYRKFKHLRHLSNLFRASAWMFYRFNDGLRWLDLSLFLRPRTVHRGRTDRIHVHAFERIIMVPPTLYKDVREAIGQEGRIAGTPEMELRAEKRQAYFAALRAAADAA